MAKALTEKQKSFIQYLVHDGLGTMAALEKAGYSKYSLPDVMDNLREAIVDETEVWLATHAPGAARKLVSHMEEDDSVMPGAEKRLEAAKQILDRVGLTKRERTQTIQGTQLGIVFLPPKEHGNE